MLSRALALGITACLTTAIVACGSSVESKFGVGEDGDGSGNVGDDGAGGGSLTGNSNGAGPNAGDPNAQCATSTAQAELVPVYLVFMYDRSGSMEEEGKWGACKAGINQFFADSKSSGLNASLSFFSQQDECNADYSKPSVEMRALPDATNFSKAIGDVKPEGRTPTLPALKGALAYAKKQQGLHPGAKVAVVLVTDGIPLGCNSSVKSVSAEAKASAGVIPTYVVGVGDETKSLNDIAVGGGTSKAFIIPSNDPTKTTAEFQKALAVIRGQALACEFKIPAAPAGKELNLEEVNVVYTAAGKNQTFAYDAGCTQGGWRYDDVKKPTKIVLCKSTCDTVQATQGGRIDVVTGCATKGGIPR